MPDTTFLTLEQIGTFFSGYFELLKDNFLGTALIIGVMSGFYFIFQLFSNPLYGGRNKRR